MRKWRAFGRNPQITGTVEQSVQVKQRIVTIRWPFVLTEKERIANLTEKKLGRIAITATFLNYIFCLKSI